MGGTAQAQPGYIVKHTGAWLQAKHSWGWGRGCTRLGTQRFPFQSLASWELLDARSNAMPLYGSSLLSAACPTQQKAQGNTHVHTGTSPHSPPQALCPQPGCKDDLAVPGPGSCRRAVPPDPGGVTGVQRRERLQLGAAGPDWYPREPAAAPMGWRTRTPRPAGRHSPLPRPIPPSRSLLRKARPEFHHQNASISSPPQSCSKSPGFRRQARVRRGRAAGGSAVTD